MALIVDLKPNERIIIANVSVRNGERRARLIFETEAKFLREKDILAASEAVTACEHLYVVLQMIYFIRKDQELENKFTEISNEIMKASPSSSPYIAEIYNNLVIGEYYASLKSGQKLMLYEKQLHNSLTSGNT